MTTQAAAVSRRGARPATLAFAYDGRTRRIRKLVEEKLSGSWVTSAGYTVRVRWVEPHGGWSISARLPMPHQQPAPPLDRSCAGRTCGVRISAATSKERAEWEGLLAITRHDHGAVPSKDYWATSDLSSNIVGLINENGLRAFVRIRPLRQAAR